MMGSTIRQPMRAAQWRSCVRCEFVKPMNCTRKRTIFAYHRHTQVTELIPQIFDGVETDQSGYK